MRVFETGATRDTDENKLDFEGFLSPAFLYAFANYMHKHRVQADGALRASDNWQKGIPSEAYMKSAFRHFMEAWSLWRANGKGLSPEMVEALLALTFNVQGLITNAAQESEAAFAAWAQAVEAQHESSQRGQRSQSDTSALSHPTASTAQTQPSRQLRLIAKSNPPSESHTVHGSNQD